MKLRFGTRGSPLALAQSNEIARCLQKLDPSLEIEQVVIHTSGDRFSAAPADNVVAEGGKSESIPIVDVKAMFVKEIEAALLDGSIDFAVHSAKDLPGDMSAGLEIAAFPPREDPHDAYIGGPKAPRWEDVPAGTVIGTSSLRRQIQLTLARPGVTFAQLRGNVDTRLKRLEEGNVAAIVLAVAGLNRLGLDLIAHESIPIEAMVPAPGQGALAVQARSNRDDVLRLLAPLDDAKTRIEVECERLFLKAMGGGCQMPLGANAQAEMPADKNLMATVKFSVFWSDLKGKNPIRRSGVCMASQERMSAFIQDIADQIHKTSDENGR